MDDAYSIPVGKKSLVEWRLDEHSADIEKLDEKKADKEVVTNLAESVDNLRKILMTFMGTVAGSAIVISGSILVTHVK